jgi:hypothetical protein
MTIRALGGRRLGIVILIVLAMATFTIFVHGISDIGQFFLLGQAFGLFAFDLSGFVVALETLLDRIALFQIRPGLTLVIMVAFPARDFVFGNVFFVRKSNKTLFVFERCVHLNFIRRFRAGANSRYQKQTRSQSDNQHNPQGPFVHQLDTSLCGLVVTLFSDGVFYQLRPDVSTQLAIRSGAILLSFRRYFASKCLPVIET